MTFKKLTWALLAVLVLCCCSAANAKELVLQPKKIATLTSPDNARDTRVLVYFELPGELRTAGVVIDNAALIFKSRVSDADLGMLDICPVTRSWEQAGAVTWNSSWDRPGGDFSTAVAGRSVSIKPEAGDKQVASNVTFVVKAWLDGTLENHGLIIVPSQEDISTTAVKYSLDVSGLVLKIHYGD